MNRPVARVGLMSSVGLGMLVALLVEPAPFVVAAQEGTAGCYLGENLDDCTRRRGWTSRRLWTSQERFRARNLMDAAQWGTGDECADARQAAYALIDRYPLGWGQHRRFDGATYSWGRGPSNNFAIFDHDLSGRDHELLVTVVHEGAHAVLDWPEIGNGDRNAGFAETCVVSVEW